ncbi:MAG TPA: zf-HC2 domain-containing protein [Pirellulales bacterium]|nr:zf-HC2 domain-containing protein [Pirellulales bacterium]
MTCQEALEALSEYLGGNLSPEAKNQFERHLAACPACREYVRTFEQAIRLGKAACRDLEDAHAARLPEELIRAILRPPKP